MSQMSIGDLSTSFWNQIQNRRLKIAIQNLGQEISTGRTTNIHSATVGDFKNISGIEGALTNLNAFKTSAAEAALFSETTQRSLESLQDATSENSSALLTAAFSDSESIIKVTTDDIRSRFESIVSILNTQIGNRSLFSGTATNKNALISSEGIITELRSITSTETTASGIEAAVQSWFDDSGGGFESIAYQGSNANLAPIRIGPNESVTLKFRADSQEIRNVLKGYALASLISDGILAGNTEERLILTKAAADQLFSGGDAITEMRAEIGTVEARVDFVRTKNSTESYALEIARSEILDIDPYQSVTELQNTQNQLEMLFAVTAKLAKLSFVNYIT